MFDIDLISTSIIFISIDFACDHDGLKGQKSEHSGYIMVLKKN